MLRHPPQPALGVGVGDDVGDHARVTRVVLVADDARAPLPGGLVEDRAHTGALTADLERCGPDDLVGIGAVLAAIDVRRRDSRKHRARPLADIAHDAVVGDKAFHHLQHGF